MEHEPGTSQRSARGTGMGLWLVIGLGVGAVVGIVTRNPVRWMIVGVLLGTVLGIGVNLILWQRQ
jgi:xanthine/uracil permease